jgi:plasmid stability protein
VRPRPRRAGQCYLVAAGDSILVVPQVITRMDDELAAALKARARAAGVSVNEYVTRLVRVAVGAPAGEDRSWKAAGVADGWLIDRPPANPRLAASREWLDRPRTFPPGYRNPVVEERDEHR